MISRKPRWMVYKEQMDSFHYGDALWEPAPNQDYERVRLGDVGYIRRGHFHLLFSAGCPLGSRRLGVDVPSTFEPLDVGRITFGEPRPPGYLCTNTNEGIGPGVKTSTFRNPPVKPGTNLLFELIQEQGAALITKYSTFREDAELQATFEDYTKRHYNSWVTFARSKQCGNDVKPILVSGVDMTRDFAMMGYSNKGACRSCKFIVSGPITGSSSEYVWGKWKTKTQGVVHANCGPRHSPREALEHEPPDIGARETPKNYNQCVFVRYYTMRFREFVPPELVKAGAGPGGNRDKDKTLPELTTWWSLNSRSEIDEVGDSAQANPSSDVGYDFGLELFRNVLLEEKDVFDIIAEYVLKNSGAESVLMHHRDIAQLREGVPRMEMLEALSERRPAVKMDDSGVGRVAHRSREQLETSSSSSLDATVGHAQYPAPKSHTPIRPPTWEVPSLHPSSNNVKTSGGPQGIRLRPPPAPQFTPTPQNPPQARYLPHTSVPPAKLPALQSGRLLPTTQDVVPIRPPPMSTRRSNSSPAIGCIPSPDTPSPLPSTSSPHRSSTDPPQRYKPSIERAPVGDEEALSLAMALSEKELKEQAGRAIQEEDDIAKAIEESLGYAPSFGIPVPSSNAGPSTSPGTTSSPRSFSVSESPDSQRISLASSHLTYISTSTPTSRVLSPLVLPEKPGVGDGEVSAQWFSDEEEERIVSAGLSNPGTASVLLPSPKLETITPPAPVSSAALRKRREARQQRLSVTNADPESPLPPYYPPAPTKTSPKSTPYNASLVEKPRTGRPQSWGGQHPTSSSAGVGFSMLTNPNSHPPEQSLDPPLALPPSLSTSAEPVMPNAFVDQKLLNGVSLGFGPPLISNIKTTLKGGVPNVIPLPAGKFVPFHIQAPDWRHLLKMMAGLSGSRIEASDEALATLGQELKLRTVIQFVKVAPATQDWRTVIYLTIDNPPPATASRKFTNGDVTAFPYSYTLGSLPHLLRDGSNSQWSKYYTIPATPNVPYPTLPISFPNMAGYLASAVDDSRKMLNDNASGMRRLAKTLDLLYPGEVELGMEDDGSDGPFGGMMNAFRSVLGKGRRGKQRSSDDYADLVTPFVPEWG